MSGCATLCGTPNLGLSVCRQTPKVSGHSAARRRLGQRHPMDQLCVRTSEEGALRGDVGKRGEGAPGRRISGMSSARGPSRGCCAEVRGRVGVAVVGRMACLAARIVFESAHTRPPAPVSTPRRPLGACCRRPTAQQNAPSAGIVRLSLHSPRLCTPARGSPAARFTPKREPAQPLHPSWTARRSSAHRPRRPPSEFTCARAHRRDMHLSRRKTAVPLL